MASSISIVRQSPPSCQVSALDSAIDAIVHPFTHSDVDYLQSHLSVRQLRRDIHAADIQHSVSRALGEEPFFPWDKWQLCCKLALKFQLLSQAPVPRESNNCHSFDIQEIKRAADIVSIIGQYTTLRKSGRNYIGLCPLHDDHNPSFIVYPKQQSWHCFGACNTGGDVVDFIMAINNVDIHNALTLLVGGAR